MHSCMADGEDIVLGTSCDDHDGCSMKRLSDNSIKQECVVFDGIFEKFIELYI